MRLILYILRYIQYWINIQSPLLSDQRCWHGQCYVVSLQWRQNEHDSVSNHQPHDCLFNCLFRRRSKKTSKLRVTGLCVGNSPGTGEFPAKMASNAENVSIWWRHHVRNTTFTNYPFFLKRGILLQSEYNSYCFGQVSHFICWGIFVRVSQEIIFMEKVPFGPVIGGPSHRMVIMAVMAAFINMLTIPWTFMTAAAHVINVS